MIGKEIFKPLTEEEFDSFNENVGFIVNGVYELKLDKGYMCFKSVGV